ncbi:unnamed protein product [Caenorhabditis auriculariae]|uniref:AATF leucine zipper-containing domain-containing protein n=1 Tax=Caenorhabditis auriculariae TaxID=2777116 RepID=A0A8S1GRL7_9PELO|nr:unnamed protein product [Caenorhabditis auriculariae]
MSLVEELEKWAQPTTLLPDVESADFETAGLKFEKANNIANQPFSDGIEQAYRGRKVSRAEIFKDSGQEEERKEEESDTQDDNISFDEQSLDDSMSGSSAHEPGIDFVTKTDHKNITFHSTAQTEKKSRNEEKSEAIIEQKKLWDQLMLANIRVHGLIKFCNVLPRGSVRKELLQASDKHTKIAITTASDNLTLLRSLLREACQYYRESSEIGKQPDDEEIESSEDEAEQDDQVDSDAAPEDDDYDDEDQSDFEDETRENKQNKSVTKTELNACLKATDESYDNFRNTTLTKWHNRTKAVAKTKGAQTSRGGEDRVDFEPGATEEDDEIFDDVDFYQTLLKEMIENKSSSSTNNTTNALDMTRNYIELQSLLKTNKKRDTANFSSKERRLKFEPISKLVNFNPATPESIEWAHESRNQLFQSLFT